MKKVVALFMALLFSLSLSSSVYALTKEEQRQQSAILAATALMIFMMIDDDDDKDIVSHGLGRAGRIRYSFGPTYYDLSSQSGDQMIGGGEARRHAIPMLVFTVSY